MRVPPTLTLHTHMHRCYALLLVAIFAAAALQAQPGPARPTMDAQQLLTANPVMRLAARAAIADDARLDQVLRRGWINGAWQDMSRNVYVYNGEFRTEEWQYTFSDGVEESDSRTLHTYDGQQRLATSTEQWWDSESENFLPRYRQRFFYQGDAPISTDTYYDEWDASENDFVPVERETYTVETFDGVSVITEGESLEWDGDSWLAVARFTIEQVGDDVVYANYEWDGAAWQNDERTTYADLTIVELYTRLTELLQGLEEIPDAYVNLAIPDGTTEQWEDGAWVFASRQVTENFFDWMHGLLIRQISRHETWDEGEWIAQSRRVMVYEIEGNASRLDTLYVDGASDEEWVTVIREAYDYDDEGRLQDIYLDVNYGVGELAPWMWTTLMWTGTGTGVDDEPLAHRFALEPAYPNPFNPATTIGFRLETPGDVAVQVFDVLGRNVATLARGAYPAGEHVLQFEAGHLPSGTYIVRLESAGATRTRTVTLLK